MNETTEKHIKLWEEHSRLYAVEVSNKIVKDIRRLADELERQIESRTRNGQEMMLGADFDHAIKWGIANLRVDILHRLVGDFTGVVITESRKENSNV